MYHRFIYFSSFLFFTYSCAPSGLEGDRLENEKNNSGMPNAFHDESYYIGEAFRIGALDKDSVGDYVLAQKYLDSAIFFNPQSAKAFRLKASVSLLQDNVDSAMKWVDRSLQIDPEDKNTFYVRANVFLQMGKSDKALEDYYQIIQIDSLDGRAYETIGYMEFNRGNKTKACHFLKKARDLGHYPSNRRGDSLMCL